MAIPNQTPAPQSPPPAPAENNGNGTPTTANLTRSTFVNPKLKQGVEMIEGALKPEYFDAYARILQAGLRILYSPQTKDEVLAQLDKVQSPQDIPEVVRDGVTTLIRVIFKASGGKMKADAAMPAAHVLMFYVLDDIQAKTKIEIADPILVATTKALNQGMFNILGIKKQQIDEAILAAKQGGGNGASPDAGAPAEAQPAPAQESEPVEDDEDEEA